MVNLRTTDWTWWCNCGTEGTAGDREGAIERLTEHLKNDCEERGGYPTGGTIHEHLHNDDFEDGKGR